MALFGPSDKAKAAHRAIGARWKRIFYTMGACGANGTKFIKLANDAFASYAATSEDDFDEQAIGPWQADVYRIEQELVDAGCAEGVKGSATQTANRDPLPQYDAEKDGSWWFRAADSIDKSAPKPEDAANWWGKLPFAVKIGAGATVAAVLLGNLARVLRR